LEDQDDDFAEEEEEGLEAMAEELIETTFPPGCSWECYLARYNDLSETLEHTEEAALTYWLHAGQDHGRDCTCKDDTVIDETQITEEEDGDESIATEEEGDQPLLDAEAAVTAEEAAPATEANEDEDQSTSTEEEGEQPLVTVDDEVFKEIEDIEEEIEELEDQDDDFAEEEEEGLEAMAEELIETTFPPGCSWECYLARYNDLSETLEHTEEAALTYWLHAGQDHGRDCTCKDDTVIDETQITEEEDGDESIATEEEEEPVKTFGGNDVFEEIETVEEQIEALEAQDDDIAEQEMEDLEELEEELLETAVENEMLEGSFDHDDEYEGDDDAFGGDDDYEGVEDLEEEIEEIEEDIEAIEGEDDDGEFMEEKEEEIEYLLGIEEEVEEELQEEIIMENEFEELYNNTLSSFENGEASSHNDDEETLPFVSWGNWDSMQVGVGLALASVVLMIFTVYQCKKSKSFRGARRGGHYDDVGEHNDGYADIEMSHELS